MPGDDIVKLKVCSKCKIHKPISEFPKNSAKPDGLHHYCRPCDKKRRKRYRDNNPYKIREERKIRTRRVMLAVIEAYGGKCYECGEDRPLALTVHHLDGGGNEHRDSIKRRSGTAFYEWLKSNNFPKGFGLLCGTCHLIKHRKENTER